MSITSTELRQAFIRFFESKQHQFVKSNSVVPDNDPTLLFTNAGMNQFKDVFLGEGTRPYTRAVNSQLCIRVSGKHNDLEDVGRDGTHLTLFEMLGNWSFGDYYKKDAIIWAWEFLTEVLNFPQDKLVITVFEEDDEAEQLWLDHTPISPNHVVRCGKKDNFWEMGETGPCGPCSEIHLDLAPDSAPSDIERDPETGGLSERYVELWNLVFIQHNRQEDGSLENLPQTHVDTGAGFERLLAQLQGVKTVYDTDLFSPIIDQISTKTGVPYSPDEAGMPHRVIADHLRTLTFAIADNVIPSNEGRGYVLRRLLRRAMRYAKKLGHNDLLLHKLVPTLVSVMGDFFEQIKAREDFIMSMIEAEEKAFLRTLDAGVDIFETMASTLKKQDKNVFSGEQIFKLYDTYGFPFDLTQIMAEEIGFTLDEDGFNVALNSQKQQSRQARQNKKEAQKEADKKEKKERKERQEKQDQDNNAPLTKDDAPVHRGIFDQPKGGEARLVYRAEDQVNLARHHTGTHLLHEALREVLGDHVNQAGSVVDLHHLHFDFTHFKQVTKDELKQVEAIINKKISEKLPVAIHQKNLDEAKAMGAKALFGETYDKDDVRVVAIADYSIELCGGHHVLNTVDIETLHLIHEASVSTGVRRIEAIAGNENWSEYSQKKQDKKRSELQQRYNKLQSDHKTLLGYDPDASPLPDFSQIDTASYDELTAIEPKLIDLSKQLEKKLAQGKDKRAGQDISDIIAKATPLNGAELNLLITRCEGYDLPMLRTLSDNLMNMKPNLICVLTADHDDAGLFLVRVPKDFPNRDGGFRAGELFNRLAEIAGGRGGGPPHMAQGGGADPTKIDQALDAARDFLSSLTLS